MGISLTSKRIYLSYIQDNLIIKTICVDIDSLFPMKGNSIVPYNPKTCINHSISDKAEGSKQEICYGRALQFDHN